LQNYFLLSQIFRQDLFHLLALQTVARLQGHLIDHEAKIALDMVTRPILIANVIVTNPANKKTEFRISVALLVAGIANILMCVSWDMLLSLAFLAIYQTKSRKRVHRRNVRGVWLHHNA
jgi:hypothetical protein